LIKFVCPVLSDPVSSRRDPQLLLYCHRDESREQAFSVTNA
jgi:hypothetical protein